MPAAKTSTKVKAAPAKTVAEAIVAIEKLPPKQQFNSAAALIDAAAPGTGKSVGQRIRQLKRDAAEKVGRGKRYNGITPHDIVTLYKAAQAEKGTKKASADKAKAKKAPAKDKEAVASK